MRLMSLLPELRIFSSLFSIWLRLQYRLCHVFLSCSPLNIWRCDRPRLVMLDYKWGLPCSNTSCKIGPSWLAEGALDYESPAVEKESFLKRVTFHSSGQSFRSLALPLCAQTFWSGGDRELVKLQLAPHPPKELRLKGQFPCECRRSNHSSGHFLQHLP